MVNFKRLVKQQREVNNQNLNELFNSLDRHASHIDLRPAQEQALKLLTNRRTERDLILKISTGAGKTLIGLIYLLSYMEENKEPGVYLCPTIQLAEQILEEAIKLGIKAELYPPKEAYPSPDGTQGKSVIVCTYVKLFNAKSTFDRQDVLLRPGAIVLDDVHAGIENIRNHFTLRVTSDELLINFLNLLSSSCSNYLPGLWENLYNGEPDLCLDVPYWIWKTLVPEIIKMLTPHAEDDNFKFVWPFLRDILPYCRCIVTSKCIEIIPDVLPVENIKAYIQAKHRLFTSGTLADDSILVREIGTDIEAGRNPVVSEKNYGLGERMVLAPSLVGKNLDRGYVMELSKTLAKSFNVVVLCPNEPRAREWEKIGAQIVMGEDVSPAVRRLRDPKSNFDLIVFVQRYDGIDLPDNACRVLIIDGMPFGTSLTDKYDSSMKSIPAGMRNIIVYRLEQGMGRAVRSHVDYAVIILAGDDIANFIAKKEVLKAMNPDTRTQLQLALDLANLAKEDSLEEPGKAFSNMIMQCLKRDEDWKQYYDENVRNIEVTVKPTPDYKLEIANAERQAFNFALGNNPNEAVQVLRNAINSWVSSDEEKGWYLQKVASYLFDFKPAEAFKVQREAYELDRSLFRPPETKIKPLSIKGMVIQEIILNWFNRFDNPNGAIAEIQVLRSRLSFEVSSETMEQALLDLAPLLGAHSSRPEKEFGIGLMTSGFGLPLVL